MVSRVAVESLKKAEDLKEITSNLQKMDYNCNIWPAQQQLQKIYHDVLILDLEYALDKKVEQDLWNYCFKNYIASLQSSAKDKKANGIHVQNRLSWFLDCASGFYLSLLQEICSVFNLDLPFMRHDTLFGFKRYVNENVVINRPERSSCYYICQHCLVHLGDVARYRNQMIQAESFYRHAVELGSSSGHPYNQLALLEASRDRLSTVFFYTRSIAVAHKFPAAITNLANTLMKSSKFEVPGDGGKMSVAEYEAAFLHLHSLLYLTQDTASALRILYCLNQSLTPLIATQEFTPWKLIQMAVITIFMYTQMDGNKEVSKVLADHLVGFLNALLVPLYTMSPESVLDYFALPPVKVVLCWLKAEPSAVVALNRQHLWRGLTKLLNLLRSSHATTPVNFINAALPEDTDLQGFLPLEPEFSSLTFSGEPLQEDVAKKLRAFRLIKYGEWLSMKPDLKPIFISENGQFEVSRFPTNASTPPDNNQKLSPLNSGNVQDNWKSRSRQNVALQSFLKKSKPQVNEKSLEINSVLEWQDKNQLSAPWWPQGGSQKDETPAWVNQDILLMSNQLSNYNIKTEGTYTLFSGTSENPSMITNNLLQSNSTVPLANHQSLWSGPGPSPLERLLEQQKQMRSASEYDT
ncbi:unnamed protein product [Nezara viridula]|uniref:Protein SMG7 n=1 Tax=Nezara viridula TaxID=85310 RepID=A0A9P0MRG2_NEZVI|nr:unnamed protein product [Nezara viridula]